MGNDYECRAHAKTRLRYHVIFSTKYRRKCLDPIRGSVLSAFFKTGKEKGITIHCMELDSDHVHLLLSWKPAMSISEAIQFLKYFSTKYIWEENPEYLKKFYWKKREIWTGGYFCSTIGDVSEKTLKKYIENQG